MSDDQRVVVVVVNSDKGSTSAQLQPSMSEAQRYKQQVETIFGKSANLFFSLIPVPAEMSDRDAMTWAIEQVRRFKDNIKQGGPDCG